MNHRRVANEEVPWRTSEAAAAYLGVGEKELRDLVRHRQIAVIDGPGPWRFLLRDLDAYLEHQRQPAAWEQPAATRSSVRALPATGTNVLTGLPRAAAPAARRTGTGEGGAR